MPDGVAEFRYRPEPDGTGLLTVAAQHGDFSGRARAWFDTAALEKFAVSLRRYPLPDGDPVELSGGMSPHELIGLRVRPLGHLGQISVALHLASERPTWPPVRDDAVHDVRLEIPTTYERIRAFSEDLIALVEARVSEARLEGELLIR